MTRRVLGNLVGCDGEQSFGECTEGASKSQFLTDTRYLGVSRLQSGDPYTLEEP